MAKTYTFTDIPKITSPSATAVAGGSLLPNVTYYYRIYKMRTSGSAYSYGRSIISDEFSVTTDSVNKTARITFSSPFVAGAGYMIFRFTTPGQMNIYTNAVTFWPSDNVHNSGGTVTFDDTGYAAATGNTFLEDRDNPHGRLVLSGSSSSDRFTINELYDADVANGWGVILKLDENTYKVNTHLYMGGQYFDAVEKTIIFADGIDIPGDWTLGRVLGANRTYGGCNIIIKSNWLTSIQFTKLVAYRTSFQYVFPKNNDVDITSGLGLCHIGFAGDSIVQDCTCDRSRSFAPSNTSILKNVIVSRFDVAFGSSQATFDDVKCLSGSRVWQYGGSSTNVVARGVYIESANAMLVINASSGSSLTLIDSIAPSPMLGSYIGNDGFEYFDKFSYNLKVLEQDEITPIANATITMYDNSEQIFQVVTDENGEIEEQYITRVYGIVDTPSLPSVYTYTDKFPYKLVIEKDGYETYVENFTQELSNPIVKIVALKTAKPIRISTDGPVLALSPETGSSSLLKKL